MSTCIRKSVYTGKIQGVILDWAGTAIDYGCMGPVSVFIEAFSRFGISVSEAETRQFMGLMKKDHIRGMCGLPSVKARWVEKFGWEPGENDVEALYAEAEPLMVSQITNHADPIPGLLEFIDELRKNGIPIGSTTGYTRPMMEALMPTARKLGYAPDVMVCSSDVPAGRPHPFMCYQNAIQLQVYPLEAMIKIGDTVSDIQEGGNAGMWTIGVTQSGNCLGLTPDQIDRLDKTELARRLQAIENIMREAGAHYVAEGIWACLPIIRDIDMRLARGETPAGCVDR